MSQESEYEETQDSQDSQFSDYPYRSHHNEQTVVNEDCEEDIQKSIDLTITLQTNSFLDGRQLIEYVPKDRIRALLKSNYLVEKWDDEIYSQKIARKNYKNEKEQIVDYLHLYDNVLGGCVVKYKKSGRSKWGRVFPQNSLGFTTFRRQLRNTLIKDLYYDIDIKNSQPEIVRNICYANNIDCPEVEYFCLNRNEILEELMTLYNVEKWVIKQLFISLFFNGTFLGWKMRHNIPYEASATTFIKNLTTEIETIANKFKEANPQLFEAIKKVSEETKKTLSPDSKSKKDNEIGSFFALYLQEYEYRIVSEILKYLMTETTLMNHPNKQSDFKVGSYEYDGFKVLKQNVDAYEGGLAQFLIDINHKVVELTGFDIIFDEKAPDEYYTIDDIISTLKADVKNPDLQKLCDDLEYSFSTPTQIALFVKNNMPKRKNHFIYLIEEGNEEEARWYCWSIEENRWIRGADTLRKCIQFEIKNYAISLLSVYYDDDQSNNENSQLYENGLKIIETARKRSLEIPASQSSIIKAGEIIFNKYSNEIKFDLNTMLLGMKNGVYDFKEQVFRPYRYNDYITMTTGFDFIPSYPGLKYIKLEYENGKDEPNQIIKTIEGCPEHLYLTNKNYETLLNLLNSIFMDEPLKFYVLHVLSTGLLGSIQQYFMFNGSGRNGKGIINGLMYHALGNYYIDANKHLLLETAKGVKSSDHSTSLCELDKKRYVVFRELPQKNILLQNSSIKHLTGGGIIQARRAHSPKPSPVNLHLTLVIEVNEKPNFAEEHVNADKERLRDVPFLSKFTDDETELDNSKRIFKINTQYNDPSFQQSVQNEFLNLLIVFANRYLDNGCKFEVPDIVIQRSAEYSQGTKVLHQVFTEIFEQRDASKTYEKDKDYSLPEIVKIINNSNSWGYVNREDKKPYESAEKKKAFFRENGKFYGYYKDASEKELLRNWRLIPKEV